MTTLTVQIVKMSPITVINNAAEKIYVSITVSTEDNGGTESDEWRDLDAHGGSNTWGRTSKQVIRFTRSLTPGVLVETVLGVPDTTVNIY